ncbi:obscurin-like protein 1 isoform X2 [Polyodon spathula]|uniref:obscurin-like protein 1 isoform X2 n=1 Tax=Polyodon spathula TaxID=7913 RepID=UPI001B7DEABC|nr:obscurin-like protein 1 isoform X2 [Polyodon spathula]
MDVFGGAPRFLAYPRPLVVQSGTDAALKCQIAGDPRPAVIWERANKKLHPDGRYRLFEDGNVYNLIISRVGAEDSGQYICKAKNSIGETYAAATLKVEGEAQEKELREENRPRFLIKPLSVRVGRGEDAVFSCKLWGKPRPEIIWEKDGKKLNDIFESAHFSIGHQDGGWFQLKIFQTRAPDAGVYTCRARNEYGEALAGAVLLVDAGPGHEEEAATRNGYANGHWKHHQGKRGSRFNGTHKIEEPEPNSAKVKMFTVSEGKHAKFRCYVTGKPKPEIVWRKDGIVIMSGRRYLLYEDREGYFTLKVLYCKQQDNGLYVCAASNTAGQTLSAVHLNVKEPTVRFKQPLNDVEVRERELAVLECEVSVDTIPTTWYLEDRRLQPGAKYGIEQRGTVRRLTIRDIGTDDDGIYLCEMADGGRSIAEVSVRGTIVRRLPRKVDLLEGENAAFCVEVKEEEMDIHWYKDGLELRETHQTILKSFGKTHILVFVNATPQDSGIVTFIVGRSKTSSRLRVKAVRRSPPSCPVGVQMNTERSNSALLSWVPAHDSRKNPPTGYVLERQEVGSQEWLQCLTTEIASAVEILGDSVPSEADYRFRICSVNKYGRSGHVEFSSVVHLVPVARIKTPLQDVLVSEGKDAKFSIELSTLVIGTWFLNGSQIQEDERYTIHRSRTEHSLRLKATNPSDNRSEITFIAYGVRDSAMLYVQPPPVKFEPLPEMDRNKKIEAGSPVVLYCELSDANAHVHWYKDGVELHTQEGIHVQSEGTMRRLVIQSADFSHSGEYRCDAIDDVLKFNVDVEAPRVKFAALSLMDRHKNIESGSPIELCCELSNPNTQVCWYKDGTELHPQDGLDIQSEGTKRQLVIQSAKVSHSGVYTCDALDDVIKFNVAVEAPPVKFAALSEMDRNKKIEAGSPVVLYCELSDANAQVHWYKDGVELHTQEGIHIQSEGTTRRLVIQSADFSHSGEYRCDAIDDVLKFNVDVEAPRVKFAALSLMDRHKNIESGSPIELCCELSNPNIQVCWYKDGTELHPQDGLDIQSEGTKRQLVIQSAKVSHSGVYTCDALDDVIKFNVVVEAPPVKFAALSEMDRYKKIEAGSPVVLYCELSDANAQVHWYKDGVELHTQEGIHIQSEGTTRRLVIQSADFSHSGEYRCDAIDDVLKFNVDVEAPRVKFAALSLMDRHKNIESGSPIELCCELSNPNTQVCWYKDGTELHPQDGLDIQSEGTKRQLVIQSAKVSHHGVYSCDTLDDVIKFNVAVEAPPVKFAALSEMDRHKIIESGSPIELCCELSNPNTLVHWYKDGTKLHPQEGFNIQSVGSTRRLVIHSAEISHSGVYSCDAVDDVIKFNVDVEAPPVKFAALSEMDRHKIIESGSPIELCCELSNPNTWVRWFKDGMELHPQEGFDIQSEGSTRRLIIHSAEISHSGLYSCDAVDDVIKFIVDVEAPPVKFNPLPEADLHKSIVECSPIVLYCEVSRPDAPVRWYKDGIEIQPRDGITVQSDNTMRRLVIQSSKLSDSGVYTCHAVDDAMIFNVNIREPPATVVHPREDVHLEHQVSERIVLSCELSRSNAAVHWYKDGQELLESDDVILESEGPHRRLIILQGHTEDSGEYVCDTADDSIFYQVTVIEPAVQIVSPSQTPMELEFLTEDRVVLSCEVSRHNADVRWFQDGLELEETEDLILEAEGIHRRLIIPKAAVQDSAEYICDAVDDSVTFMVKITEPPVKFVRHHKAPGAVKVFVGDPVVLECEVSRSNAMVSWWKEGQEMEESREVTIEENGVLRRLTIHYPKLEDSGNYFCDAKDETMDFRVKVTEAPVQIKRKGELKTQQQVMVSDDVVLECELSRVNGTVKWYKDGEKITDNERVCLEEEGAFRSLVILNAETSDSGEYFCDACDDSVVYHVYVKEPPVTIIGNSDSPEHHSLIAGDDLVLTCELSRSNAMVEWYCNGKPLSSEDSRICIETLGSVRQLVISGLRPSDSAEYICDAGDDKMVTTVTVKEMPVQILNKDDAKESIEVVENESVTLCARVSKEDAVVQWLKNWRDMSGERYCTSSDGKSRLFSIHKVQLSDSGVYTCDAFSDEIHFTLQVKAAPITFERKQEKPEDVFATETENTIMSAVLSSDKSQVKWFRHQSQIFDSEKYEMRVEGRVHSLIVKNTSKEDCGMYTCVSQDDQMAFVVSVKELKLNFVRSLEEVYAYKDDTIILRCELCKPKGDVQWQKDGQKIRPSRYLVINADGREHSLTIHHATGNDTGEYVCESKDDKTCARVTVEMPRVVEVISELHNITVLEGEDATLKCVVSPEDAELVWHRNGNVVVPDDKFVVSRNGLCHTLTIRDCQLTDSSKVTAEAEGVVSEANLQVQEAQVLFTKKMETVIAEEHGEAMLEVEVSVESGEVQWMRQGVVIQPSPKFTLSAKGRKRSLTVHNLTFSDRGIFRCETLHDRTQGKLNVEPRKISIKKGLTDTETLERDTTSFEVEVSHVDVQGVWQKDGIRIKPNNNWRVSTHERMHALTMSNLTLEDSGTITFSAESVRTSARLTVKEPPVMFLRALEDLRIAESSGASFECELSRQNADVKWLKNGEELKPGKNYRIYSMGRKRFLQITKCGSADSGTYTCDAVDNKVTAVLEVYEREVKIVQGLQDAAIQEDENAVFMCEVSVENVKGEWLRNGEKIKPTSTIRIRQEGNKHFLLICNVKTEDSGKITFVAKQAESTANLEVEELPVQIVKPLRDKTALEKHRVILECTVSNPRCSVRWYQGKTLILPSDHYEICSEGCYRKLVIRQVTAMDEGTYSVQVGEHESSARLLVEG